MWTYKEGHWVYYQGTIQADYFIGDGSQLTNVPISGSETDPIFSGASAAMNVQISSSSNAIIASKAMWAVASYTGAQGLAASNAIIASKAMWAQAYSYGLTGVSASNAINASAAQWANAYTQAYAASNAIIASGASWTRGDINGTSTSNAYIASAANWQAAYVQGVAASNAIVQIKTVDNSTASTAYVANVLYWTGATPPTASGFPIGTIYIQYTA